MKGSRSRRNRYVARNRLPSHAIEVLQTRPIVIRIHRRHICQRQRDNNILNAWIRQADREFGMSVRAFGGHHVINADHGAIVIAAIWTSTIVKDRADALSINNRSATGVG